MSVKKLLALVTLFFLHAVVGAEAASLQVKDFCLTEEIEGNTGKENFSLGKFLMKARLTINGSHFDLDAWNEMPDNSQTLKIHADGNLRKNEPTPIRFIDNFDNRGRGSFTLTKSSLHIDIDVVKTSPQGLNISRNYGTFDLKSEGCK